MDNGKLISGRTGLTDLAIVRALSLFLIFTNLRYNMFTYFSLAIIDVEQFFNIIG